jgi:hypothetical protein
VEVFDFRLFVGDPLSPSEVKALAAAPTPVIDEVFKCEVASSDRLLDTSWDNGLGQDCPWMFDNKDQYPGDHPSSPH